MMIILVLFILLTALFYFLFLIRISLGLDKIKTLRNVLKTKDENFISVIIPFRNEENKILKNLESIRKLNFDKTKFEVIYVDDNSTDNSVAVLKKEITESNIKIISVESKDVNTGHKKIAVNFGINNSKGNIIFTTDADCLVPVDWLKIISSEFDENTAFVSGAVKFNSDGSLWHTLQQLEFSGLVLAGGGLILSGSPIICNAANLAFRKSVFFEVGGYSDNLNLSSGDDELLMQKIHHTTDYKVRFIYDKKAIVTTEPNESLSDFYNQRKRWASKGVHYKSKILVVSLIMIYLFFLILPIQLLAGIFLNKYFILSAFITLLIKSFLEYRIIAIGKNILIDKLHTNSFVIAQLLHIPYIILAGLLGLFGNFKWKERKLER